MTRHNPRRRQAERAKSTDEEGFNKGEVKGKTETETGEEKIEYPEGTAKRGENQESQRKKKKPGIPYHTIHRNADMKDFRIGTFVHFLAGKHRGNVAIYPQNRRYGRIGGRSAIVAENGGSGISRGSRRRNPAGKERVML